MFKEENRVRTQKFLIFLKNSLQLQKAYAIM